MAINWDSKISDVKVSAKRATITFTRTDTESALAPIEFSFSNAIIAGDNPEETQVIRQALLETVKSKVLEAEQETIRISEMITNLEQAAKSALESWEASR